MPVPWEVHTIILTATDEETEALQGWVTWVWSYHQEVANLGFDPRSVTWEAGLSATTIPAVRHPPAPTYHCPLLILVHVDGAMWPLLWQPNEYAIPVFWNTTQSRRFVLLGFSMCLQYVAYSRYQYLLNEWIHPSFKAQLNTAFFRKLSITPFLWVKKLLPCAPNMHALYSYNSWTLALI